MIICEIIFLDRTICLILLSKQKEMDQRIKYYIGKMDSHKKTGYLFGKIPFRFNLVKNEAVFLFALFFFIIGFISGFMIISLLIFILISTEYTRVFDYRELIINECIIYEEMFRIEMIERGIDPNFPNDPLYITTDDRSGYFIDVICLNKSFHIFKKASLFVKRANVFRS